MLTISTLSLFDMQLLKDFITPQRISLFIRVIMMLGIGIPAIGVITRFTRHVIKDKLSLQSELIITRTVKYTLTILLFMMVLNEFGFKISALLGAAGILGVAVGFASQTSVSNIISGFFLISEKPFQIGDTIEVEEITGIIDSIDLLSVKLKTYDNRYVRIPNETMIKTGVINLTRFPIRRVQTILRVAYKEDISRVLEILRDIADNLPDVHKERAPLILIDSLSESSVNINFGVWTNTANVFNMKTQMILTVKKRFEEEGIEIPWPQIEINKT
jgi:small-conductance mechanosensitive channel